MYQVSLTRAQILMIGDALNNRAKAFDAEMKNAPEQTKEIWKDAAAERRALSKILVEAMELDEEAFFQKWLDTEFPGHDVHDHEHQDAYHSWIRSHRIAFFAGRASR